MWDSIKYYYALAEVQHLLWWIYGGIAAIFVLQIFVPRGRPKNKTTPEARVYQYLCAVLFIHFGVGIALACVEYYLWYQAKPPLIPIYEPWPLATAYAVLLVLEVWLIMSFVYQRFVHYRPVHAF